MANQIGRLNLVTTPRTLTTERDANFKLSEIPEIRMSTAIQVTPTNKASVQFEIIQRVAVTDVVSKNAINKAKTSW